MKGPKRFGVYTARFPFLDSDDGKIRPVIVISEAYGDHNVVAIIPISSRPKREAVDTDLVDWHIEGLLKASVARIHRLTTTLQADLLAELGELTLKDTGILQKSLREFLGL